MTEKLEFSATDMATAAADGFRDGQRAALTEATNNTSGLIRMVRSHGSVCWEELDGESFELCQQDSDYECREFYTAPPADNQGTTSDTYRAELYDEVWQKARDMGYGNVTEALVALDRMKSAPPAAAVVRDAFMKMRNVAAGYSNCCEFDSANARRLEREFEAADELYRSAAAPTPEPVSPWISVEDRLPEPFTVVALMHDDRWMNTGAGDFQANWTAAGWLDDSFGRPHWSVIGEMRAQCLDAATHWMPLPSAPEQPAKEVQ